MRKIKTLEKRIKGRKNYFPTLIITIFFWYLLTLTIFFLDPETPGAIFLFFILVFFAILFTTSLIFNNTRRGVLLSIGSLTFLIFRYLGIGNLLNLLIICGVLISLEIFFSRHS